MRQKRAYKWTPFKTLDVNDIRVTREMCTEIFDNWIKARTANCDMALKDALSFISDRK